MGRTFGAFGLWLKPRDMAKIGKMVVQNGMWDGKQIVSAKWLEQSTKIYAGGEYGYYWWVWEENKLFKAHGHGGQIIAVSKDKNLVIVLTADPYSNEGVLSPNDEKLLSDIKDAILE